MTYIHVKKVGNRRYYTLRISVRDKQGNVLTKDLENLGSDVSKIKIGTLENNKKILLQQVKDKTFITLPNAILFPSGYATIGKQGVETLKTISGVLENHPNRSICIEGHTDNVSIGPKLKDKYASNWELSAARAISVKHYMSRNFKFDQRKMSVKGYGPYKPVAPNTTPEGKSKNRRVVIVIGPRI